MHKAVPANPDVLEQLIEPYRDDLVIGIECMCCWYWVADFCKDNDITFILANTANQYNLPPNRTIYVDGKRSN